MELEYSRSKTDSYAYVFSSWERKLIREAIKAKIKTIQAKLYRVENSPKNEGQATYINKARELRNEIASINKMIETLNY